jgi:hypothetical protein
MLRLAALALAAAAALLACAGPGRAEHRNLCPDSQTRCVTGEDCSFDRNRGCFVCVCREPEAAPQRPAWVPEVPGPPPPRP